MSEEITNSVNLERSATVVEQTAEPTVEPIAEPTVELAEPTADEIEEQIELEIESELKAEMESVQEQTKSGVVTYSKFAEVANADPDGDAEVETDSSNMTPVTNPMTYDTPDDEAEEGITDDEENNRECSEEHEATEEDVDSAEFNDLATGTRDQPRVPPPKYSTPPPFKYAIEVYQDILDESILQAMKELKRNHDKSRYARVRLPLFGKYIEIEIEKEDTSESDVHRYVLHLLHYGPINKRIVSSLKFPEDATEDYVKATKFCHRDLGIWLRTNAEGKTSGGDGTGVGGTACSPFRDTQIALRDKGYYLQDLSHYVYDNAKGKHYYRIDIRLYQDPLAVKPEAYWHEYGVIPGMRDIVEKAQAELAANPPPEKESYPGRRRHKGNRNQNNRQNNRRGQNHKNKHSNRNQKKSPKLSKSSKSSKSSGSSGYDHGDFNPVIDASQNE